MSAMEPLCHLLGICSKNFSKEEQDLLEVELFIQICSELKEFFRKTYQEFFYFMKFTTEMENEMLENNLTKFILRQILATNEYTILGIANYTGIHKDVLYDLVSGLNTQPLAIYLRRIMEVHRTVNRELYEGIGKKIGLEYSSRVLNKK